MKNKTPYFLLPLLLLLLACMKVNSQTKIMTYNLRFDNPRDNENAWSERKDEVVQLLDYYAPDFCGTQEGLHSQLAYIAEKIPNFKFVGGARDDGKQKGEYSAIFYNSAKFDLLETTTFWLSPSQDTGSVGWDAALPRVCTYGIFKNKMSNDTLYIFNAHFDHIGEMARKMSATLIVEKIKTLGLLNKKIILMGDFNCTPQQDPIQIFKKELHDGLDISKKPLYGPSGTFNSFDAQLIPQNRIDYIFTKNMEVLSYRHINDKRQNGLCVSDHLPVLVYMGPGSR